MAEQTKVPILTIDGLKPHKWLRFRVSRNEGEFDVIRADSTSAYHKEIRNKFLEEIEGTDIKFHQIIDGGKIDIHHRNGGIAIFSCSSDFNVPERKGLEAHEHPLRGETVKIFQENGYPDVVIGDFKY